MGFLFVDRITAMEPGRSIQGIKHVTYSDRYLYTALQGTLAFLPSLIGETIGQLAAWCAMDTCDFKIRPVAGVASEVKVYGDAVVGDTIVLNAVIDECNSEVVQYSGTAMVRGKTIFVIEAALGPMLPMEEFIDPEIAKQQFARIYRPGEISFDSRDRESSKVIMPEAMSSSSPHEFAIFDRIISLVPKEYAVAEKLVSLAAPYFSEHFPRKPVLPLTILLNCKLELAKLFIAKSLVSQQHRMTTITMRKIKMKEFVYPGDVVTTKLTCKELTENTVILSFDSEANSKRVCVVELVATY